MDLQVILIGGLLLVVVGLLVKPHIQKVFSAKAESVQVSRELAAACQALSGELSKISESNALIQGYLEGLVRVCETQVQQVGLLTDAVSSFTAVVVAAKAAEETSYDEGFAEAEPRLREAILTPEERSAKYFENKD